MKCEAGDGHMLSEIQAQKNRGAGPGASEGADVPQSLAVSLVLSVALSIMPTY